jgi:hypothetical protein
MQEAAMNRIVPPKVILDPAAARQKSKSLGHLALHARPGECLMAARFFELLGCHIQEYGPFGNNGYFHIVALNREAPHEPDNIIFLSTMQPEQVALEKAITDFLGVGTDKPHPALAAYEAQKAKVPEYFLHFGIHFSTLEDLEAATSRLQEERRTNPAFAGRIQGFQTLRAQPGHDADIDARMKASKVFANADLEAYGAYIVQVHIRTDLFSAGMGFVGVVVELDYVFRGAGREYNAFNSMTTAG